MKRGLDKRLRASWDAVIDTEGRAFGLVGCRPFLENKIVNDIFYEGTANGTPCIVKCSSRAPDSIENEYEMSRRLSAVAPVCAEALAKWRSRDGRMAFVVTRRLEGPSLTQMLSRGVAGEEAVSALRDMVGIAEALLEAGIVWRDIITDNFMMDGGHLKLIDAQFAIDRRNFREDPFLASRWTYRTLLFAHHPDMAGRGWNDVAMMLRFSRLFAAGDEGEALRDRLRAMSAEAAFPAEYGFVDDVRMALTLASLQLRRPFASRRRRGVLEERAARAKRFLARRTQW